MATVKDVWNLLDRKAPFRTQMDFDNAGFLVGRGDQQVTRVLVALDITPEVIREAAEKGCQLIDHNTSSFHTLAWVIRCCPPVCDTSGPTNRQAHSKQPMWPP